ncbi:hypothetical protein HN240_19175, partial [Acinetobacter baumannii]|uniref:hypothetical protein n=1 Tax=Acinetobacter baumannii TaxID=470 RepID=UPI0018E09AAB
NDEHLGRGQGQLVLGGGLGGQVDVRWAQGRMTVLPFKLTGPNGIALALRQAISAPFAMEGDVTPELTLSYRDVHLQTTDSHLHWRPNDIQWRGAVALSGQWEGYRLAGGWRGDIGPTGVHGEPVRVTLDGNAL